MKKNHRFDINPRKVREWLKGHNFPPALLIFILGIFSTIWFLIRVIPKPSRATYPCMQVAAPLMSGFIVYLLSLGGIMLALKKVKQNLFQAKVSCNSHVFMFCHNRTHFHSYSRNR